jgi:DNA-binding PadR family transcriptional regulator
VSHGTAFSPQTIVVLRLLGDDPHAWWHGYDLARRTGLKSGTLYPILIRLAERGLLEAAWEDEQPAGRPRRHCYRLTADGAQKAASMSVAERALPQQRPVLGEP